MQPPIAGSRALLSHSHSRDRSSPLSVRHERYRTLARSTRKTISGVGGGLDKLSLRRSTRASRTRRADGARRHRRDPASPILAHDHPTACSGRPKRVQLLCSDGCIRLEVARICEALRRERPGAVKRVRAPSREEKHRQDLEQLIASLDCPRTAAGSPLWAQPKRSRSHACHPVARKPVFALPYHLRFPPRERSLRACPRLAGTRSSTTRVLEPEKKRQNPAIEVLA